LIPYIKDWKRRQDYGGGGCGYSYAGRKGESPMCRVAINEMVTEKLPPGDPRWKQFTGSFRNREVDVIDFCNEIYTGHAYTTWQKEAWRSSENFQLGQHLAVDLDTEDKRSTIDELRKHELVSLYGGIIHTSPSHTAQAPRARVIFLLDQPITTAEGYTAASNFMIAQFGSDSVCKDPSRFFYGAKGCELWFDEGVLPLSHLRTYYKQWAAKQPKQKPRKQPRIETPAQVKTELGKVQAALATIDPWSVPYDKWIAILAALNHTFGDEALPLAEQWAQGRDNEVVRKWKTFGRYSGTPAGLGSIFHLARTH
jgi:hypothetical protein